MENKEYNDLIEEWNQNPPEIDIEKSKISPLGYLFKMLSPLGFSDKEIYSVYKLSKQTKTSIPKLFTHAIQNELKGAQVA